MSDNKRGAGTSASEYTNIEAVRMLSADMADQGVALVIVGGDLIDGRGEDSEGLQRQYAAWKDAMSPVYRAGIAVYAVPGNHEYWCDTENSCVSAWEKTMVPAFPGGRTDNPALPGMEYSFVFRNTLFIGLDQNRFASSFPDYYRGDDIEWIAGRLADRNPASQPHVVVFGHMPQFMTQWEWTRPEDKSNREAFWNLLGEAGCRMYFTGHSHLFAAGDASTEDGSRSIYQTIAGSGGAEPEAQQWDGVYAEHGRVRPVAWDENRYRTGYALVTIRGRDVTTEWRYYDPAAGAFRSEPVFSYTQP